MGRKPRLCIQCGKLIGLESECPYCGANNANPLLRLKRAMAPGQDTWSLTAIFVGINVFLFLLSCVQGLETGGGGMEIARPSGELVFRLGIQDNAAIRAGQWWRIITAIFLHLGVIHLLFNCYVLWITGKYVEDEFGGRLMFLIYMASGIAGFIASYYADIGGGGASGAISGLMGAILVRRWLADGHLNHPMARYALILTMLSVVFSLMPGINYMAHLVGFIAGAGISGLLSKVRLRRKGALGLLLLSVVLALVTVVALGSMLVSLTRGGPHDFLTANQCWLGEVKGLGMASPVKRLGTARECIAEIPDMEEPADRAREEALRGLDIMSSARKRHDVPGVKEGFEVLEGAWNGYLEWAVEARDRYNIGYVRQ
jgi:rhomboid protease GluP